MAALKVLQVGSSMPDDWGGVERYVAVLSQALAQKGHDVSVSAPKGSPLSHRAGVRTVALSVRGKYDFAGCAAYLRLFRAEKFDVVNTHFSPDYLMPAYAAKIAGQKGTVLTRHVAVTLRRSRVRAYSGFYERFIAVSGAVKDDMVVSGFDSKRVTAALAGVPALRPAKPREETRKELGVGSDDFAVGSFGRLVPEKGVDTLIEAVRALDGSVGCHVFGEGPQRPALERLAVGTPTTFHGYVPSIDDAMSAMDVVALPSVWVEALGLAVLEAMSVGRAVVASRTGGVPEVIEDGVNGLLVPPGEPQTLAEALKRLKDDPELRESLGRKGQDRHRERFTPEAFADRIEAVYLGL